MQLQRGILPARMLRVSEPIEFLTCNDFPVAAACIFMSFSQEAPGYATRT